MDDNTKNFIAHVRSECKLHDVKLRLSPYKRVRSHGYCSGYFSDDPRELAVSKKSSEFLGILVHEFCHMQQWLDKTSVWTDTITECGVEAWELMVDYLDGVHFDQKDIDRAFEIIMLCERDCDMRSVKMIKKYKLPIDVKTYIKQANAYHYFYHVVKDTRKWYGKMPIYMNKNVINLCPDNFRRNTVRSIPDDIYAAILDHIESK